MSKTGIILTDYGNTQSVFNALDFCGLNPVYLAHPEKMDEVSRVVLPGVGHAGLVLKEIQARGFDEKLSRCVFEGSLPFLGICVGMQILFSFLREGNLPGLRWFDGEVSQFSEVNKDSSPINMGWSAVENCNHVDELIMKNIPLRRKHFYFCHKYAVFQTQEKINLIWSKNEQKFLAGLFRDNILATQFHPEKSGRSGLDLLRNFGNLD